MTDRLTNQPTDDNDNKLEGNSIYSERTVYVEFLFQTVPLKVEDKKPTLDSGRIED